MHVLRGAQGVPVGRGAVAGGNCVDGKARPGDAVFARVLYEREAAVFDGEGSRGRGGEGPARRGLQRMGYLERILAFDLCLVVLVVRRGGAIVDGWMWVGRVVMR
jgi:hypothetical protein